MEQVETVGSPRRRLSRRLSVLGELLTFMWHNKLWWMIPIILVLLLLTAMIVFTGSVAVPFLYPLA